MPPEWTRRRLYMLNANTSARTKYFRRQTCIGTTFSQRCCSCSVYNHDVRTLIRVMLTVPKRRINRMFESSEFKLTRKMWMAPIKNGDKLQEDELGRLQLQHSLKIRGALRSKVIVMQCDQRLVVYATKYLKRAPIGDLRCRRFNHPRCGATELVFHILSYSIAIMNHSKLKWRYFLTRVRHGGHSAQTTRQRQQRPS